MASVSRLSRIAVSAAVLFMPIMCRARFLRNASLSLDGTVDPGGRSHAFSVSPLSRSTSIHRPPISSTSGRYEFPRSRIEISGLRRAIIVRNICAMNVLPPPDFAVISIDDIVIVATAGKLVAYELSTGKPRWFGSNGGDGYSSPQLFTIDGVAQILLMSGHGAASVAPADGTVLWDYPWESGTRIVQPALTSDG